MGEYAIRKSDGAKVKIGTCEDMYYLRYEDRDKVKHLDGNVDPVKDAHELRFRLPFPDEDNVRPGDYEDYNRGYLLHRGEWFTDESTADDPGIIQLTHKCGLLVNVPCYHGVRLPEVGASKVFWNGKSPAFVIRRLRPTPDGVKPVVECQFCNRAWRYNWSDVWEYIGDTAMRIALRPYMEHEQATRQAVTAMTARRFLQPDDTSRIDAVGWTIGEKGDITLRIAAYDGPCCFWSWNAGEKDRALTVLANLVESLQALQRAATA